jgi:alpha-D-ribose 1-methylphosphonate 5-triphosphate diphosphatase PhnM
MKRCIFNAAVVGPDSILPHHGVIIEDDRIHSLIPMDSLPLGVLSRDGVDLFDARGGYVMPGFIDIHSAYIRGILRPRPARLVDFRIGLREAEKYLLGHGITTVYHSLPRMKNGGGPGRTRENLERLEDCIQDLHRGRHLIRHRLYTRHGIGGGPEKFFLMKKEFPAELAAAQKARDEGLFVVMGASGVMPGDGGPEKRSAMEAIREGRADILCSGNYPASLLHAAFALEEEGILSLPEAVRMLTVNPAKAMGIAADYGSVAPGKKADLLVVKKSPGCPLLSGCFTGGQMTLRYEYRL